MKRSKRYLSSLSQDGGPYCDLFMLIHFFPKRFQNGALPWAEFGLARIQPRSFPFRYECFYSPLFVFLGLIELTVLQICIVFRPLLIIKVCYYFHETGASGICSNDCPGRVFQCDCLVYIDTTSHNLLPFFVLRLRANPVAIFCIYVLKE